jgi:hypothetical protein
MLCCLWQTLRAGFCEYLTIVLDYSKPTKRRPMFLTANDQGYLSNVSKTGNVVHEAVLMDGLQLLASST